MTPERWQQVKDLFQSAIERTPSQRAAFVQQASAGDSELQSEVESLLAHEESDLGSLDRPPRVAGELLVNHQSEPEVGHRIGSYKVLCEIGRGGMGAVYLAERADGQYQKQVAIKLVKQDVDRNAALRRFRNEQQILANLDHPNIAKLLDGGTTEDGLSYFVMDYVDGLPIDQYCDARKLQTVERLKLFLTACSAVHYAHQHHVIHRDLKPTNILVTADGIPKLLDFGIAKLLDPELADQTTDRTVGLRPMTPQYASPEHVRGEAITRASDVYSLGLLLYELLTGHRPYHLQSRTPQEIQRVICDQEPEKPSAVVTRVEQLPGTDGKAPITLTPESVSATRDGRPEKLRRRLAGELDNIVMMALRKEPERRYSSVEELSEDIRKHVEGLPIVARKDAVLYRSAKFIRRNKVGVLAGGLITALLIAVIGVGLSLFTRANKAITSIAVLPLENLSGDPSQEYIADGMTEAFITELAQIGALRVISRTSAMQFKGVHKPLPEVARQLKVEAVVEGSVLRAGDQVRITAQLIHAATEKHLWSRVYERDLRDVPALEKEVAQAIARELGIGLSQQERARLQGHRPVKREAYEAYVKGTYFRRKRTPEDLNKAQEFLREAIEKDPGYAPAYAGLADYYFILAFDRGAPRQYFPKVKEAATKALEIDETLAEAHTELARTFSFYDRDWPSAEREFRRALELNPSYALGHRAYSSYLSGMGRHREAIAEAKRAQELDPLSPGIIEGVGQSYYFARQYDQAIEHNRKALEIDPNFWMARLFSGYAYERKGMYREALAELQQAREGNLEILANIGFVHAASGRPRQAERVFEELITLSKERYVPSWYMMKIYLALGQVDQAFAYLEKAFEEREGRLLWVKIDPMFDSLRSDPRFDDLLGRMHLSR